MLSRDAKKTSKSTKNTVKEGKPTRKANPKTVLEGASIFELIMPWKSNLKGLDQIEKEKQVKTVKQPSLASFLQ